jgi:alanyl-tRNA synthetase
VPYVPGAKADSPAGLANVSLRVIADHARAATFLTADGVRPENLGRGYVLRRIFRRAVRHGRKIGLKKPFMAEMVAAVVRNIGDAYPELRGAESYVKTILNAEEERFGETLEGGLKLLTEAMEEIEVKNADLRDRVLPGSLVFKLYDTFGFPVDLSADVARERGFAIDVPGFDAAMEEQKAKGRAAWKGDRDGAGLPPAVAKLAAEGFKTGFLGHRTLEAGATPALVLENSVELNGVREAGESGRALTLVFPETPFYAAAGGQETDSGTILFPGGKVRVDEVQKAPGTGIFLHSGVLVEGKIDPGTPATLRVDRERRKKTAANHSATHLLHKALRTVLGDTARQAGSLVSSERLRFDFTHFAALTREEIEKIEDLVNADVRADHPVETVEMPVEEAVRSGAMALFEERYGESVRVVSMGDSRELCGGTHVERTGEIGLFLLTSEGAVSGGVRRIEGLTGEAALARVREDGKVLRDLSGFLKARPDELRERIEKLRGRIRELERSKEKKPDGGLPDPGLLASGAVQKNGIKFLAAKVPASSPGELRETADLLRDKLGDSGVMALASENEGKALLLVAVGKALAGKHKAGTIIREMAAAVGGKGGGRDDLAQAGGPLVQNTDEALKLARTLVLGEDREPR